MVWTPEPARGRKAQLAGQEFITIALALDPHRPRYEAVRISKSSPAEYAIVGIWLPLHKRFRVAEVGALIVNHFQAHNAIIV